MYKTQIFETYQDFLSREDKEINGVSPEFAEANPNYKEDNKTNKGCWINLSRLKCNVYVSSYRPITM